jgi:hypothetical protein
MSPGHLVGPLPINWQHRQHTPPYQVGDDALSSAQVEIRVGLLLHVGRLSFEETPQDPPDAAPLREREMHVPPPLPDTAMIDSVRKPKPDLHVECTGVVFGAADRCRPANFAT